MNDETEPPTLELAEPETLYELAEQVSVIRTAMLYAGADGSEDLSEQHIVLAFAALDTAAAQLKLAAIHQARALAGGRRG